MFVGTPNFVSSDSTMLATIFATISIHSLTSSSSLDILHLLIDILSCILEDLGIFSHSGEGLFLEFIFHTYKTRLEVRSMTGGDCEIIVDVFVRGIY